MLEETKYCCRKEEVDAAASILFERAICTMWGDTKNGKHVPSIVIVCPKGIGVLCHLSKRILNLYGGANKLLSAPPYLGANKLLTAPPYRGAIKLLTAPPY